MLGKILLVILSIIVLLGGAAAGVYLVQRRQNLQQEAASTSGSADMSLSPANNNSLSVNNDFSIDVIFSSPSEPVSSIQVKIDYTYTGTDPVLFPTDVTENQTLIQNHHWNYPNKHTSCSNGTCTITFTALQTGAGGFSSPGSNTLATLNFNVRAAGSVQLVFDEAQTKIISSTTNEDILSASSLLGPWSYSNGTGSNPTNSPTPINTVPPTQGTNPVHSPTPTTTSSGSSNNVCNLACNSSSDCGGGLTCYQGQCRNDSCRSEGDCDCTVGPTSTPRPNATATVAPTNAAGGVDGEETAELPAAGSTANTLMLIAFGILVMLGGAILAAKQ